MKGILACSVSYDIHVGYKRVKFRVQRSDSVTRNKGECKKVPNSS